MARQRGPGIMLRDRLVAYFAANPDDTLTIEDITIKFDARPEGARPAVRALVKVGLLVSEGKRTHPKVIGLGPELARIIGRPVDSAGAAQP